MGVDLVRSVKEQAVLKLYDDDLITVGEASEMLALSRVQFLDLLGKSGIGFRVDLDDEDFNMLHRLHAERTENSR
jgi:predicted HTH domain antitoxin